MKNSKKHSHFVTALSIVIGISFAISFGYYNKAVAKEQTTTSVSINSEGSRSLKPIILDVADQGVVKKWLQPNHLIGRYEIKNAGKEPLTIQIHAVNFTSDIIVESGSPGFQRPSAEVIAILNPGQSTRIKVRVNLPNGGLSDPKQYLGILRILNQQTGDLLGDSSIYAINSIGEARVEKTSTIPVGQHEGHKKSE